MNQHSPLASPVVTQDHRDQFEREGYFVLENVVPAQHLELLRARVQFHIDRIEAEMDARGVDKIGINHRGSRYFVQALPAGDETVNEFIFSDLMEQITRATLGDNVHLFFEQYVVKAAEKGGDFSWHQDSGYVDSEHTPYLTCWVTLDDVSEENGTVYLLPYERAGTREWIRHRRDEKTNDMVGYFGDDPGIPVIAPAGSVACFSSTVFHRSGANKTDKMRRIYLPQYSTEPLLRSNGQPWNMAIPFIQNGQRVR